MVIDDERRQRRKRRTLRVKFVIAAAFCLPLLYLAIVPMLWWLTIPYPSMLEPMQYPLSLALVQIVLTLPIILAGYRFFFAGLKALFQRSPNMDTLIAIGSLTSFGYSLYSTYQIYIGNFGASDRLYFASAGAIITLSLLGRMREASTQGKVRKFIKKVAGKDSNIAAWEANPSKMRPVPWTDTVSGYYVPILGTLAVIATGAWLMGGQNSTFALSVLLSVLIIACPGSLGIAAPAAACISARRGIKHGILIKGTEAFEAAGNIDTVVLGESDIICDVMTREADVVPAHTVKESSKKTIQMLKSMGIEVVMVTGDDIKTAETVAQQAGVSRLLAGIPPQDSIHAVKSLQTEGKKVAVVGSSASDAPALLQADAGIVVGLSADKAIAASDIVLTGNDLTNVAAAIQLCRKTVRILRGNLFWAFAYHVIGIPVAAGLLDLFGGPLMNPVLAMAAIILGTVSVVGNTLRLKKK